MNDQSQAVQQQLQAETRSAPSIVIQVILNPADFFRQMPKSGGYVAPLIFMVLMGATAAG